MALTAVEGVVQNGQIKLSDEIALPENTRVYVIVADQQAGVNPRIHSPRFVDPVQAEQFRKQVLELPSDVQL